MKKPKSINELLKGGGKRLNSLSDATEKRSATLKLVCAVLSPQLAQVVVSAGLIEGHLTIGVAGGSWATRLRYASDMLRSEVGSAAGTVIRTVRIKVVPSPVGARPPQDEQSDHS